MKPALLNSTQILSYARIWVCALAKKTHSLSRLYGTSVWSLLSTNCVPLHSPITIFQCFINIKYIYIQLLQNYHYCAQLLFLIKLCVCMLIIMTDTMFVCSFFRASSKCTDKQIWLPSCVNCWFNSVSFWFCHQRVCTKSLLFILHLWHCLRWVHLWFLYTPLYGQWRRFVLELGWGRVSYFTGAGYVSIVSVSSEFACAYLDFTRYVN